jgi:hypothetical protein
MLRRSWHTDFFCELFCLPDLEIECTAGVTGLQGMLTPPGHLILPHGGCDRSTGDAYSS